MKRKLFVFFSAVLSAFFIIVQTYGIIHAEEISRSKRLLTSHNPLYYANIQLNGDYIDIKGRYSGDPVTQISIIGAAAEEYTLETGEDGAFESGLVSRKGNGFEGYLCITLRSGAYMPYYICYDNGWYFPDNGLEEQNAARFADIRTATPSTAALYLSPTADADEIEQTLAQLSELAAEIIGDETDDYAKARLICRWVAENIYYDKDAAEREISLETVAVCNVLEGRRTTCAGYANTFSALLEAAGIKSVNIKGSAVAGEVSYQTLLTGVENHEWVAFWYEEGKRWVYADACWNSRNIYRYGQFTGGPCDEQYFDITGQALALNHRCDKLEQRAYFAALEGIKPPASILTQATEASEETAQASADATTETAFSAEEGAQTEQTAAQTTQASSDEPEQEEELNPLFVAMGAVLLIGIGIAAAFIAVKRKG